MSGSAEEHAASTEEPARQQPAASRSGGDHVVAQGPTSESEWSGVLMMLGLASVFLVAIAGTIFVFRMLSTGQSATVERILMCITTTPHERRSRPPDGLCDLIVYDSRPDAFATPTPFQLKSFMDYAKKLTASQCGLNVEEQGREQSLAKLKTQKGENILRSVWNDNIRSYGVLGPTISKDTAPEYISAVVDLLSTLKKYQETLKGDSYTKPVYIFVGVAPLYRTSADTEGVMKARFDELISKAAPNLVLFQTSDSRGFTQSDHRHCMTNAISVWKDPPLSDQPSFEDSLRFRKAVTLPPGTAEMLSMSLCQRFANVDPVSQFQLGEGNGCGGVSTSEMFTSHCEGGKKHSFFEPAHKLDTDRWVYLGRSKTHREIGAFEKKESIQKKMCKATVEYQYSGGWAIYGMRCSDKDNLCKDPNFTTGFARLHWMKYYMTQTFTIC